MFVFEFSGGTTVYVHGTGLDRVDAANLVVTMNYARRNSSGTTNTTETNFTSEVR